MNTPNERSHGWVIWACIIVIMLSLTAFAREIKPIQSTTAYKLLTVEHKVRQIPVDAEELLLSVIKDATTIALRTHQRPQTRDEALSVLEAIQLTLVKYNFLQPLERKDWPPTMGIALTPLNFSPDVLQELLSYESNVRRAKYIDGAKPVYFVDCDMGAQIFIAVGERVGWDIRLVELPDHNFVRWHLSDSTKINWDWTRWDSPDDSAYFGLIPTSENIRLSSLYMRSMDPKEAEAYYLGLIASKALLPTDAERLFREAVAVLPYHPTTLNNFAWLYATSPEFAKIKSSLAVAFGLSAWSMRPEYGNFADTVACAFAANGSPTLADKIEEFAMAHASSDAQRDSFRINQDRIAKGELCK